MVILLPGLGECLIFSRPQICAGLLKFQETLDLGQFISDFLPVKFGEPIAIQEIIKEYQRQKTNQRSRKGGSARKPQQYHAEAEVII